MKRISALFSRSVAVAFIALLLILVLLIFGLSYWSSNKVLRMEYRQTHMEMLDSTNRQIETMLREVDNNLLGLLQTSTIVPRFMDHHFDNEGQRLEQLHALSQNLVSMTRTNDNIYTIYLYARKSDYLLTSQTSAKRSEFADVGWLDELPQIDKHYRWISRELSVKEQNGNTVKPLITLIRTYPIMSHPQFIKGGAAVNIDGSKLAAYLGRGAADGREVFIVDGSGRIVTHSDRTMLYRDLRNEPYMSEILNRTGSGMMNARLNGKSSTVFYVGSGYTGWKIVSIVPNNYMSDTALFVRNILLVALLVLLAVATVTGIVFRRVVFNPLSDFVRNVAGQLRHAERQPRGRSQLKHVESRFNRWMTEFDQLNSRFRDSKPVLKWRFVQELLTGNPTDFPKAKTLLDMLQLNLFAEYFLVMIAEWDPNQSGVPAKDTALFSFAISNIAEEIVNQEVKGFASDQGEGKVAIVVSFGQEHERNPLTALALAELIRTKVHGFLKVAVTIGIGTVYRDLADLRGSFREASDAVKYKSVLGSDNIISFEETREVDYEHFYRIYAMSDSVTEAMKFADGKRLLQCLNRVFQEMQTGNLSPDLLDELISKIMTEALTAAAEIGVETNFDRTGHPALMETEPLASRRDSLQALLLTLSGQIAEKRASRGKNETIEAIIRFMNENYMHNQLSLNQLADEFHLSPQYLSKIFKEYTELNFIDFLIKIRMEQAMELLVSGKLNVNGIAEAVGYGNAKSFIRIFKKYTGVTPGEYRQMKKNNVSKLS